MAAALKEYGSLIAILALMGLDYLWYFFSWSKEWLNGAPCVLIFLALFIINMMTIAIVFDPNFGSGKEDSQ